MAAGVGFLCTLEDCCIGHAACLAHRLKAQRQIPFYERTDESARDSRAARTKKRISRTESGADADSFFQGYVVADTLDDEMPLNPPVVGDPVVRAATDYTRAHLDRVTISRAGTISEAECRGGNE